MTFNISPISKAWLAGFIDGEGYIGLVKQIKPTGGLRYHPQFVITSTDKKILDEILLLIPIAKWAFLRRTEGHKLGFQLKIVKYEHLREFLELIKPYLRLKYRQAELIIRFCKLRNEIKIITGRGSKGKTSFGIMDEQIFNELSNLNKRGI